MKTKSEELHGIWDTLESVFLRYDGMSKRHIAKLNKIGIGVERVKGNHIKLLIGDKIFVISATPSDNYAGRQILRTIRKAFENERSDKEL